jgi:hypothetical protein
MKSAEILGAIMVLLAASVAIELAWEWVKARLGIFNIIDRKG